jgi:hypothetical protein
MVSIDQVSSTNPIKPSRPSPIVIVEAIVVVTNGDFATSMRDNLTGLIVAGELDEFDARAFGEREIEELAAVGFAELANEGVVICAILDGGCG